MKRTVLIIISFAILATAVSVAVMTDGGYELTIIAAQGYAPSPPILTGNGYELCLGFMSQFNDEYSRMRECPGVIHWDNNYQQMHI